MVIGAFKFDVKLNFSHSICISVGFLSYTALPRKNILSAAVAGVSVAPHTHTNGQTTKANGRVERVSQTMHIPPPETLNKVICNIKSIDVTLHSHTVFNVFNVPQQSYSPTK